MMEEEEWGIYNISECLRLVVFPCMYSSPLLICTHRSESQLEHRVHNVQTTTRCKQARGISKSTEGCRIHLSNVMGSGKMVTSMISVGDWETFRINRQFLEQSVSDKIEQMVRISATFRTTINIMPSFAQGKFANVRPAPVNKRLCFLNPFASQQGSAAINHARNMQA
jgi:hypothetical protein